MQPDFVLEWFGNLETTWGVELLREMLAKDLRQNLQVRVLRLAHVLLVLFMHH